MGQPNLGANELKTVENNKQHIMIIINEYV